MMTVKELKEMLNNYPDDMQILHEKYSDYEVSQKSHWKTIQGVEKDGWVMRAHMTMSNDNKEKEQTYLACESNISKYSNIASDCGEVLYIKKRKVDDEY